MIIVTVKKAGIIASPLLSDLLHYRGKTPRIRKQLILRCGDTGKLPESLSFLHCLTFTLAATKESGPPKGEQQFSTQIICYLEEN